MFRATYVHTFCVSHIWVITMFQHRSHTLGLYLIHLSSRGCFVTGRWNDNYTGWSPREISPPDWLVCPNVSSHPCPLLLQWPQQPGRRGDANKALQSATAAPRGHNFTLCAHTKAPMHTCAAISHILFWQGERIHLSGTSLCEYSCSGSVCLVCLVEWALHNFK